MAGSIDVVNNLSKQVIAAQIEYNAAKDAEIKLDALKIEYERQIKYHQTNGDEANAQIVAGRLTPVYAQLAAAQAATKLAKEKLDDLTAQFNVAKANLTPAEQQQAQTQLQIELTNAQTDQKKLFAQATTKYLIWGAVILTVIVIGVIWYKSRYAAK